MATITITYNKPVDISAVPKSQICAIYTPGNAACDDAVFDGTYYDTNVPGYGAGMTPEEFFFAQVAHPGLIAALRAAMRAYVPAEGDTPAQAGTYDWEATDADVQYVGEIAPALADQGFTIAADSGSGSGT